MRWIVYRPRTRMHVLDQIYPEGIMIPDYFEGKNIVHLPTVKCHIYTQTTGAMKNAFGGLLNTRRHYTHSWIHETLVDLLAIQKEIHSGIFAYDGWHDCRQRSRPTDDDPGGQELHPGERRPGGDRRGRGKDDGIRPVDASRTSASPMRTGWARETRGRSRSSVPISPASPGTFMWGTTGSACSATWPGSGRSRGFRSSSSEPLSFMRSSSDPKRTTITTAGRSRTARCSRSGSEQRRGGGSSQTTKLVNSRKVRSPRCRA